MKGETCGAIIKKLAGLKPKMYSFLLEYSNEHKKCCCNNSHGEYRDVLLNSKCLGHSMERIQRKDHQQISKISLSCFEDKTHIENNGYDGLALDY